MALSTLQRQRIKHHLGLSQVEPSITQLQQDRGLLFDAITPEQELSVIGDITTNPVDETHFYIAGTPIAAEFSILWNCETVFRSLGPNQIDPSLFVSVAGSVKLRGNELQKRKQLYRFWQEQLALVFNYQVIPLRGTASNRVGYSSR